MKYYKVLIVEDDDLIANLVINMFENPEMNCKINIDRVVNGNEALKYLETNLPDLVLTDLHMPEKNGFELLSEIRNTPKIKSLPVIMMSTSNHPDDKLKSYNLNVDHYIEKPKDLDTLYKIAEFIAQYLENKKDT